MLGIQYLGYAEFDLAGRLLFSGEFQRSVSAQLDLRKFRAALAAAGHAGGMLGRASAKLAPSLDSGRRGYAWPGEIFEYSCRCVRKPPAGRCACRWPTEITPSLVRPFASAVLPMVVAPFIDSLREILVEKFPEAATHEAPAAVSLAGQ